MKLIETNFAVKIECTGLSQKVIDWFNKIVKPIDETFEFELYEGYACIIGGKPSWTSMSKYLPKDCEIITETEFLKRLHLEQTPENIKPIFTLDKTAGESVRDRNILIPIEILLKEYCETHNLDLNLCKAI